MKSGLVKSLSYQCIPYDLVVYVLKHKLTKPFALYIYLKNTCSGKRRISKGDFHNIANDMGYMSIKSVKSNLKRLIKLNWIGYDKCSNIYFIRGYDKVREMYGFENRAGVEFKLIDLPKLDGWMIAVIITKLNKWRRWQAINSKDINSDAERYKWRSKHASDFYYFPNSVSYLSSVLSISKSRIHRLLVKSWHNGFIDIKPCFEETKIKKEEIGFVREHLPEVGARLRIKDDKVVLIEPNKIFSFIYLRRRKKLG